MGKPAKKRAKKGPNSRVLTVKDLTEREYQVIHKLPHGVRAATMKGLLQAAAAYAAKTKNWELAVMSGKARLTGRG